MADVAWPFDRLRRVAMDYLGGDLRADPSDLVVGFTFDPASKGGIHLRLGATEPPFIERGVWPTPGVPVVVGGSRYYELLLEGLTESAGDRIRSDGVGVVREVIEVEAGGAAHGSVRWVVGFVEPSCMSVIADAEAARIELRFVGALP